MSHKQGEDFMIHRTAIAFAALTLLAPAAYAQGAPPTPHTQPAEGFKFLSAKDVNALTDKPGPGPKTAYLGDHENYYVEYATRSDAGNEAEVHAHWSHYINILSGEAVLTYGGTVSNARDTGPGQVRGSGITGGKTMTLHAGDYVQIPASMPHMLNPTKGTKLHYVVFNTRQ
jgi:mannose-6-phosphate isomerase-like protein (cupin superfamily)